MSAGRRPPARVGGGGVPGWVRSAVAALLGLALVALAVLALQRPPGPATPGAASASSGPARPSGATRAATVPPGTAGPAQRVLLLWTPGRLPDGLAGRVRRVDGVQRVTVVKGGLIGLAASVDAGGRPVDRPPAGSTIPLEAIGFAPDTYPALLSAPARAAFARLEADQVLLGTSSARLRRVGTGGRLRLAADTGDGPRRWLTVAGVVDDSLIGAAEMAVTQAGAKALGVATDRYLLLAYRGPRAAVAAAVRRVLPADLPARVRGPGETPFLRAGDAVLPQAMVKERFGEFAWRPGPAGSFVQDPAWRAAHLATARVPILGRVRCNRALLPALTGAMAELRRRGLAQLVDPKTYAGCWNPRLTRSGGGISRHAWGAALDLNVNGNPASTRQDPRLVQVMTHWGFTWGGDWLVPDPIHFEWLGARTPTG